jgi:aldehyde dehydrogenase (NAD+)
VKGSAIFSELDNSRLAETGDIAVHSPINGELIRRVASQSIANVDAALTQAQMAYASWRNMPAPGRGCHRRPMFLKK